MQNRQNKGKHNLDFLSDKFLDLWVKLLEMNSLKDTKMNSKSLENKLWHQDFLKAKAIKIE